MNDIMMNEIEKNNNNNIKRDRYNIIFFNKMSRFTLFEVAIYYELTGKYMNRHLI